MSLETRLVSGKIYNDGKEYDIVHEVSVIDGEFIREISRVEVVKLTIEDLKAEIDALKTKVEKLEK